MFDLLVSEDGTPHFPVFWSLEPKRVSGFDFNHLSFDENIDVAFLWTQAPLDCGFLLENEDDPKRLRQNLAIMPPKANVPRTLVDENSMKRWLKKARGDPAAQASEGKPTSSTTEQRKKQRLDAKGDAQSKLKSIGESQVGMKKAPQGPKLQPIPTTATPSAQPVSQPQTSSLPPSLVEKWWALFNNFGGRARVNNVGMRNEVKDMALKIKDMSQKVGATETSFQRIAELEKESAKTKTNITATQEAKQTLENEHNEMNSRYSDVVAEQEKLSKGLADVVVEKEKLGNDLAEVLAQKKKLAEEKTRTDANMEALQKEISVHHARGFHNAIAQVKCLNPTVNVEGVGVLKQIVDGKLVEESDNDEEWELFFCL
ncbi:hypothetical protein SESBI_29341 [Sesbania bispinosa]|nr:hypothetical protein SESBI_29341 [Sesbania bispinosa]